MVTAGFREKYGLQTKEDGHFGFALQHMADVQVLAVQTIPEAPALIDMPALQTKPAQDGLSVQQSPLVQVGATQRVVVGLGLAVYVVGQVNDEQAGLFMQQSVSPQTSELQTKVAILVFGCW